MLPWTIGISSGVIFILFDLNLTQPPPLHQNLKKAWKEMLLMESELMHSRFVAHAASLELTPLPQHLKSVRFFYSTTHIELIAVFCLTDETARIFIQTCIFHTIATILYAITRNQTHHLEEPEFRMLF